ncbi:hypothetical protein [Streptomyces albogriseolus]
MREALKATEDFGCLQTVEEHREEGGPDAPSSTPSPTVEERVVV